MRQSVISIWGTDDWCTNLAKGRPWFRKGCCFTSSNAKTSKAIYNRFVLFHSFLPISSIIIRICKGENCTCAFLILLTCHPQSLEVHSKFRVIYWSPLLKIAPGLYWSHLFMTQMKLRVYQGSPGVIGEPYKPPPPPLPILRRFVLLYSQPLLNWSLVSAIVQIVG